MDNTLEFNEIEELDNSYCAKIKIFGVGGGGCNAINRLLAAEIDGVEFIAANTDMTALRYIDKRALKIQLGRELTHGLGAGSKPSVGEQAALESKQSIQKAIEGSNLLFITAGMGGGTGTGASPVVASIAKAMNILTVAVVTKPFEHEGAEKMRMAELGIEKLRKEVDVLVVIPNQKSLEFVPNTTPIVKVMQVSDNILHDSIVGITDIVVKPALVNLDFADIETVIKNSGTAHIGVGVAKGENRAIEALRKAASSPLLETTIQGAKKLIVNITFDINLDGKSIKDALNLIKDVVAPDANIITGMGIDTELKDEVRVTVIATGFGQQAPIENVFNKATEKKTDLLSVNTNTEFSTTNDTKKFSNIEVEESDLPLFIQKLRNRKADK